MTSPTQRDLTFYGYLERGAYGYWTGIPAALLDDTWLWSPFMWDALEATPGQAADLESAGWRRWRPDRIFGRIPMYLWHFWGQLAPVLGLQHPDQPGGVRGEYEFWARAEDIAQVEAVPVALAFTLASYEPLSADMRETLVTEEDGTRLMLMAQLLPPPQIGEVGLVATAPDEEHGGWQRYTLDQLGPDAQALQQRLGAALRQLAAPAEWWPVSDSFAECRSIGYARLDTTLRAALHLARRRAKQRRSTRNGRLLRNRGKPGKPGRVKALQAKIGQVEHVHRWIEALDEAYSRRPRDKWLARWGEIQQMAQQLAAKYWTLHLAQQAGTGPAQAIIPQSERRPRGPRVPLAGLVAKDPPAVHLPSNIFAQGIIRSLLNGSEYTRYKDRGIAEYRRPLAKRKGEITITLEPGDGEGWEHVLRSLDQLGDEVVDTFCAHLALAIDTHGVENITAPMWVNTDDILRICQRKQSNRAYTPTQRAAVVEHQRIIARAHVRASWPSGRKGREYRIDSTLMDVFGQAIGEYKTITGDPVWERRQVKIGEWARLLPPLSKETAIMLRKVLAYHSKNQRHAKRLGFFLSLQFRVNAARGGIVERTMRTLLEQAGIKPDLKNPGRTQGMIEDALAHLKADGVIGNYRQVIDGTSEQERARELIAQHARGWWELYENRLWQFEPPAYVREQYRHLLRAPEAESEAT